MNFIDLHTHSSCSDGSYTPTELVELAAQTKLSAVALTDHDTVIGIKEFMEAGKKYPEIEFISGVEISTYFGSKELHFVGLYVDINNQQLLDFLENLRKERLKRNIFIAKKLYSLGFEIDQNELDYLHNDHIGRPHFAAYLVKHYGISSMQEVFEKYLRNNAVAYVKRQLPMPSEAIEVIQQAGGVAIWAHPVSRNNSNESSFVRRMLKKLKLYGLDGIECYYSSFNPIVTNMLKEKAQVFHILQSGGSDFHGNHRTGISLGVGGGSMYIPAEILEPIKKLHQERISGL